MSDPPPPAGAQRTPNAELAPASAEVRRRILALVRTARRLPLAAHDPRPARRRFETEGGLFREHRSYVPGDEARHVDWNVYARRRELVVKRTEPDERARFGLVCDLSASVVALGDPRVALHRLLTMALGAVALAQGHGVVLLGLGPDGVERSDYDEPAQLEALLRRVAGFAQGGSTPLLDAVRAAERGSRRPKSWMVVSDFLPLDGAQRFLEGAATDGVLLVHPVAREDLQPLRRGLRRLSDAETGRSRWILVTRSTAARYAELVRAHREGLSRRARERGAACFELDVREPFDLGVARILQEFARGGRGW